MLLEQALIYFLIIVAIDASTAENVGIPKFYNVTKLNEILFRNKIMREFPKSSVSISPKYFRSLDDIVTINEENKIIILRDLKLDREPKLLIKSLNPNLEYLSTKIEVKINDDIVLIGDIYFNDNPKPVGEVSYIIKNLRGDGIVGLAGNEYGNFKSTNYLITYEDDETILNGTFWNNIDNDKNVKYNRKNVKLYRAIDASKIPEKKIKNEVKKMINSILKNRLDIILGKIELKKIFRVGKSDVESLSRRSRGFYDDIVDGILKILNNQMMEKNLTRVNLLDVYIPLDFKIFGTKITVQFNALEGWMKNLSTFVRRGSITVNFDRQGLLLFGAVGLENLEFGYDACEVKLAGIGPRIEISGKIDDNAAQLGLSINFRNNSISLGTFDIIKIGNIEMRIKGLGPLNWLASKIASSLINYIREDTLAMLDKKIKQAVREVLNNMTGGKIMDKFFDDYYSYLGIRNIDHKINKNNF